VVKSLTVQPCELSRKPDGTWQREDLGTAVSLTGSGRELRQLDVALLIPETPDGKTYSLHLGGQFSRYKFSKRSDLSNAVTSGGDGQFVGECLVLAYRETNPNVITGREENMVWLFGIRVSFDEEE